MSYREQSADILLNPATDALKLPLVRQGKKRAWKRERVRHRRPGAETAPIEAQVEWTSWHGGDGFGYVPGSGVMPPVTAGNPTTTTGASLPDTRWANRMQLPTATQTLTTLAGQVPYLVFDQAGFLWVVADSGGNTVLHKIDPADGSVDATTTLVTGSTGIASRWVRFDGTVYILLGFADEVWKVDSTATVTEAADALVKWQHATVARSLLVFTVSSNEIKAVASGADPFDPANWSGSFFAGDDAIITELAALGRITYIGRTDGLNAFDTDLNLVNLIPDLAAYRDDTNCVGMIPWHGGLLVPHSRGLFFYDEAGVTQPIGPEVNPSNTTALRGQFRSLLADGAWFWGVLDRKGGTVGAGTAVLSQEAVLAREAQTEIEGQGPVEFFELQIVDTSMKPGGALISSVSGTPRLYGVVDGGALIFAPLLSTTGAPDEAGTNGSHITGVEAVRRMPATDMGQPLAPKYLRSAEVDVTNVNATGREVSIYYAIDPTTADAALTLLGTVQTPGRAELDFPAGTTCHWIQTAVGMETDLATDSPVLWRLALNYSDRIEKRTLVTATVDLSRATADRGGAWSELDPETLLALLYQYEDERTQQVLLGPNGTQYNVLVLEVTPVEEYEDTDGQDAPCSYATIVMEQVP